MVHGLQGAHANVATRAIAFLIDVVVVTTVFALGGAVIERMLGLVLGREVQLSDSRLIYTVALVIWAFFYAAYSLAVSGRTVGMSILGLQATRVDGRALGTGAAIVRVVTFPLSFLLLGLGLLLILVRRDHRALHDLVSGAVVVYSWPARAPPTCASSCGTLRPRRSPLASHADGRTSLLASLAPAEVRDC